MQERVDAKGRISIGGEGDQPVDGGLQIDHGLLGAIDFMSQNQLPQQEERLEPGLLHGPIAQARQIARFRRQGGKCAPPPCVLGEEVRPGGKFIIDQTNLALLIHQHVAGDQIAVGPAGATGAGQCTGAHEREKHLLQEIPVKLGKDGQGADLRE